MAGWIAISRDLFEHEFFAREPMSEREAWIWIISRAAWKDTRHRVGPDMVDVPRGAFVTTLREMQQAWLWGSDSRVRNFLRRLENDKMIHTKVNAKGNAKKTQISVCNYETFQTIERTPNAKSDGHGTQTERTKETREQVNKEEDGGDGSASAVSESQIAPDSAQPPTFREQILTAIGVDRSGMTGRGGTRIGTSADMAEAARWSSDLRLTEIEQLEVVRELIIKKTDGPPSSFKFFTPAMQRLAAAKAAPPLEIPTITRSPAGELQDARPQSRSSADSLNRVLTAALRIHTGQ